LDYLEAKQQQKIDDLTSRVTDLTEKLVASSGRLAGELHDQQQ
jgi:hypothetical protein